MKRFALIGLGDFGLSMLKELLKLTNNIVLLDRDRTLVETYRSRVRIVRAIDVLDEFTLCKMIPQDINAAVIDLGVKIESSIMITTFLKKLEIADIVVKAYSAEQGHILSSVGATHVVLPDREAAKKVTPMIAFDLLFNFMPLSAQLAIAEMAVHEDYVGRTLREVDVRKNFSLNIIAIRKRDAEDFCFINDPEYCFEANDVLLVAGSHKDIYAQSQDKLAHTHSFSDCFKQWFLTS
ncbi:TrkA family potassium uptake protein [Treponema pallidum]|nr:TrkA family potassium uptake protein [Treponema pallidum]